MAKQYRASKKRIPAGMPRQKLKVDGLASNKRGFWAKEEQFQELLDAGYTFVANNDNLTIGEDGHVNKGSIISRPASRSNDEKLYLMEIDKEFYAENQQQKQQRIDQHERQMFEPQNTETSYALKGNKRTMETIGHG
jgi:hypothetical protein